MSYNNEAEIKLCSEDSDVEQTVKCVLVGDGCVGKTSMIVSYTTNEYPRHYTPTAFDNYTVQVKVDGRTCKLQLCDTAGQDHMNTLRTLCYESADIFLLCFNVTDPGSAEHIRTHWAPEVRRHCPDAALLVVGTQADLRDDVQTLIELAGCHVSPVTPIEGRSLAASINAHYIECSALTQSNLKHVFDEAVELALHRRRRNARPFCCSITCLTKAISRGCCFNLK